jgi:hypothetical protein
VCNFAAKSINQFNMVKASDPALSATPCQDREARGYVFTRAGSVSDQFASTPPVVVHYR